MPKHEVVEVFECYLSQYYNGVVIVGFFELEERALELQGKLEV